MHNDWLKLYYGLGAFRGLEPQPTENVLTIVNKNAPMKAFSQKAKDPDGKASKNLAFPKIETKYDFDEIPSIQSYTISWIKI